MFPTSERRAVVFPVHFPGREHGELVVLLEQGSRGRFLGYPERPQLTARALPHFKTDLSEARAQGRLTVQDVELAADIALGIWLQVTRGTLQRQAAPDLVGRALDAVLRALGASSLGEWEEGLTGSAR